ncbi:MAG TPA: hypothetical protein VGN27_07120 [Gaiellaceae bacterium]|jgi:hypothetical protein|nr:hypothetical protein [Gaiellaceae bacterium]
MRRLVLFLSLIVVLLVGVAVFDWWIDPFGDIYKPAALTAALNEHPNCLVSEELVGARYFSFKLDLFHRRPTTRFVVGSSRVLRIAAHPGERTFTNLGFPGTAPETILSLFRALPAKPVQTVYLGVEPFWFTPKFTVPVYRPSRTQLAQYLLSRATFQFAVRFARQAHYIFFHRWTRELVGSKCVIGRQSPGIAWNTDGSRTYDYELDPTIPTPRPQYNVAGFEAGAYGNWTSFEGGRLAVLQQALEVAKQRGWHVVGFSPPEPGPLLRWLETDAQVSVRWREFLRRVPALFRAAGDRWVNVWDGQQLGCPASSFPDGFHAGAACSRLVRARLDAAAGPQ